jgi:hypothetical protein
LATGSDISPKCTAPGRKQSLFRESLYKGHVGGGLPIFQSNIWEKAMEGTRMAEGLTPEELAEAQRTFEVMKKGVEEDLWRIACLMAGKPDSQLLGRTEFEVRDHVLRIGAKAVETAVNGRKKGGTRGAAPSAGNAGETPGSSSGGKRRS